MSSENLIVYMHTNKITGKSYIGYTTRGMTERWKSHLSVANNPKRKLCEFHRSLKEYGEECWESQVLFVGFEEEFLKEAESSLISEYNTHKYGYNSNVGGSGVLKHSDETKEKMKMARRGKTPALGSKHSEETRKKYSEMRRGEGNPNWGNNASKETRKRMSDAAKARYKAGQKAPAQKRWKAISPSGDEYVFEYSLKRFCKEHELSYDAFREYINKGPIPPHTRNFKARANSDGWQLFDKF